MFDSLQYENDFETFEATQTLKNEQQKINSHQVDVVLFRFDENVQEYIPNVPALTLPNGDIKLVSIIKDLKTTGLMNGRSMLYYFSHASDMYVYCGTEPLPINMVIPGDDAISSEGKRIVYLKIRSTKDNESQLPELDLSDKFEAHSAMEYKFIESPELSDRDEDGTEDKKKRYRHKEREIGEVLDLVLKWRMLYAGVKDKITGQIIKLTLEESAKKLKVAKKSLDDYLLQIRQAKQYGFDFQAHHGEKVGVMRAYVKKCKTNTKVEEISSDSFSKEETEEELEKHRMTKINKSKKISKNKNSIY